jgi:chromosome segregation protein
MLKLRKIYLLGFKSFSDRTELAVPGTGIAVVVGPNGCGKSNILDGMNWVLGERSAKSLRGAQMQDVISAGTPERKPLGVAEVTLTFVDPAAYEGPVFLQPDLAAGPDDSADWDENEMRRLRALEAEEIASMEQPSQMPEDGSATQFASDLDGLEPGVPKIRRRRFQCAPLRGEIVITRRLFRTGESEYLLNGRLCRLRDIQNVFMDSGLGPDSYAIIGQEQIGQLLSSKPHDRRAVIEEAAGITGFKSKKRIAELRLEASRQNLARVDDTFEELSRQMSNLKRQAAKAERFALVRDELRERQRVILASRLAQIDTDHARFESEIAELTKKINHASAAIHAAETDLHSFIEQGYELDHESQEAQKQASAAEIDLERLAARERNNTERVIELEVRLVLTATQLEQTQTELNAITQEREQLNALLATAATDAQNFGQQAKALQQNAHAATEEVFSAERQLEIERRHAMQLLMQSGDARNSTIQAEESLMMLEREAERLRSEIERTQNELSNLRAEQERAKQKYESTIQALTRINSDVEAVGENLRTLRAEEAAACAHANKLRAEQAAALGRRASLESLIRDHGYATETVQRLMRPDGMEQRTGPVGTLADFLEVSGEHEDVVDEFLREELNYVVVDSWNAAEEAVRLLKARIGGRATFLIHPLAGEEPPSATQDADPIQEPGLTLLKDGIRVLNGFGSSLDAILPKLKYGYWVGNAAEAQRLASEFPKGYFLTREGDCFHNLTVTGGKPTSEGPLALKREQSGVENRLAALANELAQAETHGAGLTTNIERLIAQLETLGEQRRHIETDIANHGATLKQTESEILRLDRRLHDWTLQASRNLEARTAKRSAIEEKGEEAKRLEAEHRTAETMLDGQQAGLAILRQKRESLQQEAAQMAAELAGLEERRRNAEADFRRIDRLHADLDRRISAIAKERADAESEHEQRNRENGELIEQQQALVAARAGILAKRRAAEMQVRALRQQQTALEVDIKSSRGMLECLRDNRAGRLSEAAKLQSDLDYCEANCLAEVGIEAKTLRADARIVRIGGDELRAAEETCRLLRQRIEQMGPVNLMALDEYKETAGRHEFLEAQRRDLIESIRSAQEVIKEIDQIARAKFDEALARINENFGRVFGWLFYGGQAHLHVTDAENEKESGLEIIASPPGKKLQNVQLLSGGEKALTALALLVAIFQFRPSPFCVLDEVDAPLDETNVGRFADLMRSLSQDTQFLVVTHSKRMMQSAEMLFGVTMQEPGVSKVLSLRLDNRENQEWGSGGSQGNRA